MAMKIRPYALGIITLLLSPFYARAASPWVVTDGSTLQVTSGYDSTEINDIPLQASGAGSQLITDSGLSFSSSMSDTPVSLVSDGGSLTLNGSSLTATGEASNAVEAVSGTLTLTGSSLSVTNNAGIGVSMTASDSSITDTTIYLEGGAGAMSVYGGTLTADNVTVTSSERTSNAGIDILDNASVTLNNSLIEMASLEDERAIYIRQGHLTGSNLTALSATKLYESVRVGDDTTGTRSSLTLSDSKIVGYFVAMRLAGGDATLTNVEVILDSPLDGPYAMDIQSNSDVVVRDSKFLGSVLLAAESTSLDAANTSFKSHAKNSHALNVQHGSATLDHAYLNTTGRQGYGIYSEGTVQGKNIAITTGGGDAYGVMAANGGQLTLIDSTITTGGMQSFGVAATRQGKVSLTGGAINTVQYGATAARLMLGSDLQLNKVTITTLGNEAHGLWADNSTATLINGSEIDVYGDQAYSVTAANGSVINIAGGIFSSNGYDSAVMYSADASTITADNITLEARGDDNVGLIAALGNFTISNSTIANLGAATAANSSAAVGLYADTWSDSLKSTVKLDNTTLTSEAGTGVLVKGSTLDLSLTGNTFISGGNGTALSAISNTTDDGTVQNAWLDVTGSDQSQLSGNVITDSYDNIINLTLNDSATLNGATQNVNQLLLNGASRWLVNADSNLNTLQLNGGSVVFNNASGFNTVTVDGDLSGSGSFFLNTQLDADDSASDRLLVNGNASGDHDVTVNNRGGTGAQTDSGILLIRVAGDSSAANFTQKNTVVAGNYQYLLYKIGENSWYLQSSLVPVTPPDEASEEEEIPEPTPPDNNDEETPVPTPPDNNDEETPVPAPPDNNGEETPVPTSPDESSGSDEVLPPDVKAYRPETAGYLITPYLNSAYGFETVGSWHERLGAYQGGSVWLRVSGRHDRYDAGRFAFNVNTTFVQLGGDLATRQLANGWQLTAGPMMTLGHQRSNNKDTARSLRSDLSVNVGQTDTNAYGIGGYLTIWNEGGAYVDNVVQLTRYSNEFISLTNAKMDSYGVVASVETGIPLSLGGGFKLEPQLQAMGQYMNISQTRAEGVKLKDQNLMMARLREGLRIYYDNPVLKPYVQMDAVQFLGHTPGIDMNDETMRPDVRRGYWQAGAGISSQLNPHFSVYAQMKYSHSFGPGAEGYTGNMGFRYKF